MKSLHARVKARNKTMAGKARVAVAREMTELVHLLLDRKDTYKETPPPRPGSDVARKRKPNRRRRPAPNAGRRAGRRPVAARAKAGATK